MSLTVAGGTGSVALGANITAGGGISISAPNTVLQTSVLLSSASGNGAVSLGAITGGANDLTVVSGSGAISLGGLTTSGNLAIATSGTVTQSGPISTDNLTLAGGGAFILTDGQNVISSVAGFAGTLELADSASLSVGGPPSPPGFSVTENLALTDTAAGGIFFTNSIVVNGTITVVTTNGNITISPNLTLTADGAGNAIVIEAGANSAAGVTTGGDFVNNSGADALATPNGNWLVYTGNLNGSGTKLGGLANSGERYYTAAGYDPGSAGNVSSTGPRRSSPSPPSTRT